MNHTGAGNRAVFLCQRCRDAIDAIVDGELLGGQGDFRRRRRFIRRRDAGEISQFPRPGFGVQAFGVALFANLQRRAHVNFREPSRRHAVANAVPIGAERGNKSNDDQQSGIGHDTGDFADAADIFRPVIRRKTKVGAQAAANDVAIQHVDILAGIKELPFECHRDGAFARAAEAGEPDDAPGMPKSFGPILMGDFAFNLIQPRHFGEPVSLEWLGQSPVIQMEKSVYSGLYCSTGGCSMPAATVALVPGSTSTNEPVIRLVV